MKQLILASVILTIVAAGIFIYQFSHFREDVDTGVPTPTSMLSPTQNITPSMLPSPSPTRTENIIVLAPTKNQNVSHSFKVSGTARVFENVVSIRVKNQTTGKILAQTTTYAHAPDIGLFGSFSLSIDVPNSMSSGSVLDVEVYQVSPKDGSEVDKVEVPVVVQ